MDDGTVACAPGKVALFRTTSGRVYALNGTAQSRGVPATDPIWKDNPRIPGTKISIGPLIDAALEPCR